MSSLLLQGNSLSLIGYDARGALTGLTPVPWPWISPQVVNSRLVFDVTNTTPESALLRLPTRILAEDALHIKGRSEAGIIDRSVLSRAPSVLESASGVQDYTAAMWRNGTNPTGMVTVPVGMDTPDKKRIKANWESNFTGTQNAGKLLWADGDTKFTPITTKPVDAQVLESRRLSVEEIARLFCIPLPMLMQGSTAVADLGPYVAAFAQLCLAPIVTSIEAEWNDLLPSGQHLFIDLGGMQRGSYSAVAASQAVLKQSGITTANDARRTLGLPSHPDGDTRGTSAPPNHPADQKGVPSLAPKPGPGGDLPNVDTHNNEGSK